MTALRSGPREERHGSIARGAVAVLLLTVIAVLSSNDPALAITRVGGHGGCFSALGSDETADPQPCPAMRGVFGATQFANDLVDMAMSPDGRHIYVAASGKELTEDIFSGPSDSSLLVFVRNLRTGRLRQISDRGGCLSARAHARCVTARGISNLSDVEVSPDGRFVYTAARAPRGIAIFARDAATGTLQQLPGPDGCLLDGAGPEECTYARLVVNEPEFGGAIDVRVSPDGRHLYVLGRSLLRDRESGTVAVPPSSPCAPDIVNPVCGQLTALPSAVQFTHDGRHAYELHLGHTVRGLVTDQQTGALRRMPGAPPCWPVLPRDRCDSLSGQLQSLVLAPDERHLYVTLGVDDAIVTFVRDSATGLITRRRQLAVCGGRSTRSPCPFIDERLSTLALSPNGRRAYAIMGRTIIGYRRRASGLLTRLPWPRGCVTANRPSRGCGRTSFADNEYGVMAPDGRFLYMLGLTNVTVYRP